jgi:hypothetical protein
MSTSRALTVVGKPEPKDAKAEKVGGASEKITPPVEVLRIHTALLLAAESTTGGDPARPFLAGVHLTRREKAGRIAATDGTRMFLASFAIEGAMPSWLREGITLSSEGLRKRVQLLASVSSSPYVKLSHTKGAGHVLLADEADEAVFKIDRLSCVYPDVDRVVEAGSFVSLDEEGQPTGREWEPIGINSRYLKHCGDIAKTLEAGLDKRKRPPNGMVIRAYNSASVEAPLVFGFDSWPGAILVMMPAKLANSKVPKETAALMAPAVRLTLAALRAHITRQLVWAEEATDPTVKAMHEAKAKGFQERVAKIIEQTHAQTVIAEEKPKPEPKPEPVPEPKPEPEPEPKPPAEPEAEAEAEAEKPEIRRTPIKRKRNAA